MAKYLVQGRYNAVGLAGLQKDKASGRKAALQAAIKNLKGKLEGFYFGLNGADIVMIVEAPDQSSMVGLSVAAGASGAVELSVTPLLTVDEVDTALGVEQKYRAPGTEK